ncbi:MAG: hypothetical protein AMXMBFR34_27260 [Myxococcaceae bacterium]
MKVVDWPSGLATTTFTFPALPGGVSIVNVVESTTFTARAALSPIDTVVPGRKLFPLMMATVCPSVGPRGGMTAPIDGTLVPPLAAGLLSPQAEMSSAARAASARTRRVRMVFLPEGD